MCIRDRPGEVDLHVIAGMLVEIQVGAAADGFEFLADHVSHAIAGVLVVAGRFMFDEAAQHGSHGGELWLQVCEKLAGWNLRG